MKSEVEINETGITKKVFNLAKKFDQKIDLDCQKNCNLVEKKLKKI